MRYVKTFEGYFLPEFKLVTSNKRKLREYKEYIPELTAKKVKTYLRFFQMM
jgi:hypothetical protein